MISKIKENEILESKNLEIEKDSRKNFNDKLKPLNPAEEEIKFDNIDNLADIREELSWWQKLIAGFKCSQRDCAEALKPRKKIAKFLTEPAIIRRVRTHGDKDLI